MPSSHFNSTTFDQKTLKRLKITKLNVFLIIKSTTQLEQWLG